MTLQAWSMRKLLCAAAFVTFASGAALPESAATTPMPNPDDGAVRKGVFTSAYFNMSYPLPPGWVEDIPGPGPSTSGYYVLDNFVPAGELTGTVLIAAQDVFFAARPVDDVMAMAGEVGRSMAKVDGMSIDRPPAEVRIADRRFGRIDFSGAGLFRSVWIARIRCHFVSFNLTARSPELLEALVRSLDRLGPATGEDTGAGRRDPACMANYANAEHLLRKIDPAAAGPDFIPIPVRIVIDADGGVKHVHVIHATAGQRDNIERALGQWKLKPYEVDRHAAEIETGLLVKFLPAGGVQYKASPFEAR
jgi:hypothetical protein